MTAGATPGRPRPVSDDRDTRGFWAAAREGRLVIRVCGSCHQVLHMPRAYCHRCGTWSEEWREVSGRGTLYSWTTVEHQVHPAFPVPYTVVLVDLDDLPGTRLVGHLEGAPHLEPNQPMEAWFEQLEGGTVLPQWRPVG
ncbi:MAG TPA: OB-fold domain-containing protein [Acidimicrobiales bacterium]|nr:OB-fold domain-containing protein [Acidimicrobiales bacterium]